MSSELISQRGSTRKTIDVIRNGKTVKIDRIDQLMAGDVINDYIGKPSVYLGSNATLKELYFASNKPYMRTFICEGNVRLDPEENTIRADKYIPFDTLDGRFFETLAIRLILEERKL